MAIATIENVNYLIEKYFHQIFHLPYFQIVKFFQKYEPDRVKYIRNRAFFEQKLREERKKYQEE